MLSQQSQINQAAGSQADCRGLRPFPDCFAEAEGFARLADYLILECIAYLRSDKRELCVCALLRAKITASAKKCFPGLLLKLSAKKNKKSAIVMR